MSNAKRQLLQRFRASAVERLRRVDLALGGRFIESSEDQESVLRELHTIKGESRMLGLRAVSSVVHRLEDLLLAEQSDRAALSEESVRLAQQGISLLVSALTDAVPEGSTLKVTLAAVETALGMTPSAEPSPAAASSSRLPATESIVAPAELPAASESQHSLHGAVSAQGAPSNAPHSPTAERWIHVSSTLVDSLCDSAAELESTFRIWYSQARRTLTGTAPTAQQLRTLFEDLESYRTQFDEVTSHVWSLRLVPVEPLLMQLAQHARELAQSQGKRLHIRVSSGSAQLERSLVDALWEPLLHMVRNAIDHGIEAPAERGEKSAVGSLALTAESQGGAVLLSVQDDGRGIDPQKVRAAAVKRNLITQSAADALTEQQVHGLLFRHGFSTRTTVSDVSGRGVGLDVVLSTLDAVGGRVGIVSAVGSGTTFKLTIPARLSHERALVFRYQEALFAIPARQILDVFRISEQKVRRVVGGLAMWSRQGVLPLVSMAVALGIPAAQVDSTPEPLAIVVATSDAKWAFSIADVVGEFELLRKPADPLVSACAGCVASATLDDGRLVLYLNPATLLERARRTGQVSPQLLNRVQKRVLLVDDSAIIRQLAALVLGSGGLLVSMAANGRAALALCEQQLPDLVISDLDMPEMDGLALLTRLRARWPVLPVIIFSNHESPEYRQQAQALGADEYVVKADFDQETLLLAVDRVLTNRKGIGA